MIPVFISWTRGIAQNSLALSLICESPFVVGVETAGDVNEVIAMQEHGLLVSIHNPFHDKHLALEDSELIGHLASKEGQHLLRQADIPLTSLHMGYSVWHGAPYSYAELLQRVRIHIPQILAVCKHPLALEMPPLSVEFCHRFKDNHLVSSPQLLEKLTSEFPVNFLFDISHMFVAGMNKINAGKYEGTIEDYFDDLLRAAKGRVVQLHVNVPRIDEQGVYHDAHRLFDDDVLTHKILSLTRRVVDGSPNLRLLTLEMSSKKPPLQHTKILLEQARILHEFFDRTARHRDSLPKRLKMSV